MILASHAVIGVAAASVFPTHPIIAFSAALASHYIMDAIPHWEYDLLSSKKDLNNPLNNDIEVGKDFFSDLSKVSLDLFIGIVASLVAFYFIGLGIYSSLPILIAGISGGIIPDILQFVYFRIRREPLKSLYRFHYFIHNRYRKLEEHFLVGIFLQVIIVVLTVLSANYFLYY